MIADFDELDRVFDLAKMEPKKEHPISSEVALLIIDEGLADYTEQTFEGGGVFTLRITYRGIKFIWQPRTRPWSEIKRKTVN